MTLSHEFSKIFESHRQVLVLRKEMVEVRRKQYALWVLKARRAGFDDVGDLFEKNVVGYLDGELVALDFLLGQLDEVQANGTNVVASWEAQGRANG